MASNTSDVIVVGGGIVGCLTGYLLARQGLKVTVMEADSVGSHASGFAFGEIGAEGGAGTPDPLLRFSLWCLQRHHTLAGELKEASGVDNEFQVCDRLKLAFDDQAVRTYQEDLKWQKKVKELKIEWLNPEEVVKIEPMANPECLGAAYVQGICAVEPYRHTLAAAQAGQKFGADMVQRRVTGLLTEADRCLGVTFEGGQLEAATVILTMGPWTGQASSWCGVNLPVRPVKGQILRLQHSGNPINTSLHWGHNYVITKPDGLTWAGTTEEEVGFDEETTLNGRDTIMTDLLRIAPKLTEAQLVRQTACLRPVSADELPIVGKLPGWQNLYAGTASGRKGILWSAGMSQGLADLVLNGNSEVPNLESLDPARFSRK